MDKYDNGGLVARKPDIHKRRNELAYMALFYAITGKADRANAIRRAIRTLDTKV